MGTWFTTVSCARPSLCLLADIMMRACTSVLYSTVVDCTKSVRRWGKRCLCILLSRNAQTLLTRQELILYPRLPGNMLVSRYPSAAEIDRKKSVRGGSNSGFSV